MILRVIDKVSGLFIRDDFSFDEAAELCLNVDPSQGLILPKALFNADGTFDKWVEASIQ